MTVALSRADCAQRKVEQGLLQQLLLFFMATRPGTALAAEVRWPVVSPVQRVKEDGGGPGWDVFVVGRRVR